ncbi:MAG: SDR family oxidoreductase [Caenibius sp.]
MGRLEGKVALISGAAQGMGEAHARRFVQEGARVVLTDIIEEQGARLAAELGAGAAFLPHDVTDSQSWAEIVGEATRRFGLINVLVNNAGILGPRAKMADLAEDEFDRVMEVNLHGTFLGMRSVIPSMIEAGGGSIINISSVAGLAAVNGSPNSAYVASKFAIRGITKAAASEYGPQNIRVNSVHPGYILTPMTGAAGPALAARAEHTFLRKIGDPDEVANLVLFLAPDESSLITGAEHVIDAGLTAQ